MYPIVLLTIFRASWIYNYLCNQCLSPLMLWVRIQIVRDALVTTLCDKVCQWIATGLWFSPGIPVSSTNKSKPPRTDILLKVALNKIPTTLTLYKRVCASIYFWILWYSKFLFFSLIGMSFCSFSVVNISEWNKLMVNKLHNIYTFCMQIFKDIAFYNCINTWIVLNNTSISFDEKGLVDVLISWMVLILLFNTKIINK